MKIKRRVLEIGMAVLMLLSIFTNMSYILAKDSAVDKELSDSYVIVLDPGHGGVDPGKVATHNEKTIAEKDINLAIATKLKGYLEENGYKVYMTRNDDTGLYNDSDRNKKKTDMIARVGFSDKVNADAMISIHANSYTSSEASGAQVFFYKGSESGRVLAMNIQDSIRDMDPTNVRVQKDNDTYYLLKKTSCPTVIVESGFLTNPSEAELLLSDEYQMKLAIAIGDGIQKFFTVSR